MKSGDYELVIAPDNYPGKKDRGRYCFEHYLIYWQNTGILPKEGEIIHHKNGKKCDNTFENLELMTCQAHASLHAKLRGITYITLICSYCNKEFTKELRQVGTKIKQGQKDFYCNRSCAAKHFGRGRSKK